jgi:hypothetical protein
VNVARVSLALLAVVAAVAVVTPASASDGTCLMSNGAEPAPEGSVTISWHGGGGFVERCTSTAGTGVAEPAAQDPMASLPTAAQTPTAVVPSRAAKPTARPTARAVKAKRAKKAKAKRKSAEERKRAKARHAKCQVRR